MGLSEQRQSPAKQAQPGEPSSLAGGRPQSGPCIVCVDIPDPDNFLMVLRVLRDHRDHHVDIVISPRPVSFAAIPYGPAFLEMTRREENPVPVPIALGRVTPERQLEIRSNPNVRDSEKAWFYVDEDLTKPEVKEDTNIYLEVSKFRLITFLDNHGISRSRYSLYREANLESAKTIVPGMHHSFHKPDFAFDFKDMFFYGSEKAAQIAGLTGSDAQRFDAMCKAAIEASDIPQTPDGTKAAALRSSALFEAAVTKEKDDPDGYMLSQKRREDTRLLCNVYRQLKAKECSTLTFGSIESLVKKYKGTNIKPLLYLGGPFTEALKIIKALKGPRIGPIIAMAGATHGNSNIFANQFNILIDTASALEMLWMAQAKEIDLTLLPTECVKGTAYTLSWTDFEQKVAPWSPHTSDLYHQWAPNSPVNLFDLLAAMSVTTDLYKGMQCYVTYEVSRDAHRKGQFVFKKGDDVASSGPGLKMFWNEPSITEVRDQDGKAKEKVSFAVNTHMNNMTDIYFKEIEWTLQRLNS